MPSSTGSTRGAGVMHCQANRDSHAPHTDLCFLWAPRDACAGKHPKPLPALSLLTINEDVNPLELLQCLIHGRCDGLGLPDIDGQGQALLPCGCHQLFRGLQEQKET